MARLPVPTFAVGADGNLYVADGINPARHWDGYYPAFRNAGVPAPETAVAVGGSGSGGISGTIKAYQRWLDADGRVSNVSPVSDEYSVAASTKTITAATTAAPIVITSTAHGFSNGDTVTIDGVTGNYSANGTWVIANKTADTFELVGSIGVGTYGGGGEARKGVGTINYTSVDAPTDSRVARRQILRNKDGDMETFYVDVNTTDLTSTSFNSTNTDDDLGDEVPLRDADGNDLGITSNGEPPSFKRVVVNHKGLMWYGVDTLWTEGAAKLANASATVTGIGDTGWTAEMVGWEFYPRGANNTERYVVQSVNTSTQTLTLTESYGGDSAEYAAYALRPGQDERRTLYFSEAARPYSVDADKSVTVGEAPGDGEITALMPFQAWMFVLCEHSAYRIVYDDRPDRGEVYNSGQRGCVNQRCWVLADGDAYLMDRRGFWAYRGNSSESIGEAVQPLFKRTTGRRINWQRTEHFHAVYDPSTETIRWFVCLEGLRYPRHAICFHIRRDRWWIETFSVPIASSCLGNINGRPQVFLGSEGERVFALGHGVLDGVDPDQGTARGTVTSATSTTLTDSTATFSTALVGMPVRIVSGRGKGQVNHVAARTSATLLTLRNEWRIPPDATSVYQLGGVLCRWQTGKLRYAYSGEDEKRGLEVLWDPVDAESRFAAKVYHDQSVAAVSRRRRSVSDGVTTVAGESEFSIDATKANGFASIYTDSFKAVRADGPRFVKWELEAVPSEEQMVIQEVNVLGVRE